MQRYEKGIMEDVNWVRIVENGDYSIELLNRNSNDITGIGMLIISILTSYFLLLTSYLCYC